MYKRARKSLLKIKSSDGDEFEFDDESVEEMETLKSMKMMNDDEQVPVCSVSSKGLEKVQAWTEYQKHFRDMNLNDTFETIIVADYLANESCQARGPGLTLYRSAVKFLNTALFPCFKYLNTKIFIE